MTSRNAQYAMKTLLRIWQQQNVDIYFIHNGKAYYHIVAIFISIVFCLLWKEKMNVLLIDKNITHIK